MLTPKFCISQTDEQLKITIKAPYTQLKDVEINSLECDFWFYSSPYFLRLALPHPVVDDEEPPTMFNADKGEFEVCLRKKEPGQYFPDLDLLATLLAPRKQKEKIKPTIEILQGEMDDVDEDESEDDDWFIDQEPCPDGHLEHINAYKYGFGNLTQGIFHQLKTEFKEIIDLPDPDVTPPEEREALRKQEEDKAFCCDHYLADLMETGVVAEQLAFKPSWMTQTSDEVNLSEEERECLKKLGNKEFLLSKRDKLMAWLSLVDILFAYAYNHRACLGENNVESAWTINKLSATLAWFTCHKNIQNVAVSCCRRALTYPLYRNWNLAQLVLTDTIAILRLGRRKVLKCLLEIHSLFNQDEPRYLLNQLYISDYCIWMQKVSDAKMDKLACKLEQVKLSKSHMEFDLEELEHAAFLVQQEEEENALTKKINDINICDDESSSSGSYDSEPSSSDSGSISLDSDDDSVHDS